MTQLLDQAISEISKLLASEQDAIAYFLLEELASERRWSESFEKSQDVLEKLADEALAKHTIGRTR